MHNVGEPDNMQMKNGIKLCHSISPPIPVSNPYSSCDVSHDPASFPLGGFLMIIFQEVQKERKCFMIDDILCIMIQETKTG